MRVFVFIDASNLFYGGQKSLGWKIDYQKMFYYLKEKYETDKVFYFGGVEIHDFNHSYLNNDSVLIEELEKHLVSSIKEKGHYFDEAKLLLISRHLKRVRFYLKLKEFNYNLYLKPVKSYEQEDGSIKRKANCDVDMAFYLIKEKNNFDKVIILSGDGDFLPVLKHLKSIGKEVIILARAKRTAKEIKQFAGSNFRDFTRLKKRLEFEEKL
ncbi:NYN domain-containing protein [Patescibacteria group bacterium]|nr:NYN domain-containing protein [Patescibacteria group bacterium]